MARVLAMETNSYQAASAMTRNIKLHRCIITKAITLRIIHLGEASHVTRYGSLGCGQERTNYDLLKRCSSDRPLAEIIPVASVTSGISPFDSLSFLCEIREILMSLLKMKF